MTYQDDYDDNEDYSGGYSDDEGYGDDTASNVFQYGGRDEQLRAMLHTDHATSIVQQALDWGISGSILAVLVLTALYLFSPIDFIPDLLPVAGQLDDVAAVLAGGGSVSFLTVMRFVLRTRVGRWGCLIAIILTAMGAFVVFWILASVLNSVF